MPADATRTGALFADPSAPAVERLGPQAVVLRAFALDRAASLLEAVDAIATVSPFRHLVTPSGHAMSVAMTNAGPLGWCSDRRGYRYTSVDPETGAPWPAMPDVFAGLADEAARAAGFEGFAPDACLVNRYVPGARLSLHQDRDEHDLGEPIVSVSLGLRATFLFGGFERSDRTVRIPLFHGDVVVWGGVDRLRFHGVLPLADDVHPVLGPRRINLTFRKAG